MQSDRSLRVILHSVKQEVRDEAKQKLKDPGQIMRVFDAFPPLIDDDLMGEFRASFHNILRRTPLASIRVTDEGMDLNNECVRRAIIAFIKTIIHYAQRELLNENNEIQAEVCEWLQWPSCFSQSEVTSIICAYVGKVNQDIMGQLNKEAIGRSPEELSLVLAGVCNFITKNYKAWVGKELEATQKNTPVPVSTVIGAGVLLAGVGLTLYCAKKYHEKNNDVDQPGPIKKIQF